MNSNKDVLLHHLSELKSSVEISVASLFTKDDVLNILNFIEREVREFEVSEVEAKQEPSDDSKNQVNPYMNEEFMEELKNQIEQSVYDLANYEVVDEYSFEFDLNGNEISVSEFSVNKDVIEREIWNGIKSMLENYEEETETETEEN